MRKVSIINFKGGVGKTTISFHLACHLAKTDRVLLVDVDHQSSLSIMLLGHQLWGKKDSANETVNQIFKSFCNPNVPKPSIEIITKNAMHARDPQHNIYPNLDVVPAQFELDDTEIDLASTNFGTASLSDWTKRTLLAEWLDRITAKEKYDYVIFDCPPATKIVSQNALSCSDFFIVPVIPDEMSSRGVTHLRELVRVKIDDKLSFLKKVNQIDDKQTPDNYVGTTKLIGVLPFLVKTSGNAATGITNLHTEQLAALENQWKGLLLKKIGKHYIGISEALNAGWPVWNYWGNNARTNVKKMMREICQDLKGRIDKG
jgi:chromosome partitioning protein